MLYEKSMGSKRTLLFQNIMMQVTVKVQEIILKVWLHLQKKYSIISVASNLYNLL